MALDFRLICGDPTYWNFVGRGVTAPVVSPLADTNFPAANLYDGRPDKVFRFNGTPDYIEIDNQLLTNGQLDTWAGGLPTGWTVSTSGAGSAVAETVVGAEVVTGSAAKLTCGSGASKRAAIYQDKVVRAGETATLGYSIRGSGATGIVRVRLQNLLTGKYLTSGLTWSASISDLDTRTANTHLASTKTFTTESYATCLGDTVTLRAAFVNDDNSASTDGFVDNVTLYPSVDLMSVHGFNIDPGAVVEFRSSTDDFAANDVLQATATKVKPAFYSLLSSPVAARWWRIFFTPQEALFGGTVTNYELGEWIVAQTTTPTRVQSWPIQWGEIQEDVAATTPAGHIDSTKLGKWPRRTLGMKFLYDTHANFEEARDFFRRAGGRNHPMLVIPDAARPEIVLGKQDRSWQTQRTFNSHYTDNDLTLAELPFASSTL